MLSEDKVAKISAVWYLGISLCFSLIFFAVTSVKNYPAVARYGGSIWVFILTIIICMPIVIPMVKKKFQ